MGSFSVWNVPLPVAKGSSLRSVEGYITEVFVIIVLGE